MGHWEARVEYEGGEELTRNFPDNPDKPDADTQYEIECWLLERESESPVIWYSVNYVDDDDAEEDG